MSNARWQRIQNIYHAALERPASTRAEFLQEACTGDAALRHEVQSLLDQPISAEKFLVTGESGANDDIPAVRVGQRLGVYQVQALIGRGGMGEVYRARDTRLGRDVAIKLLPLSFVADADRCARFEREARVLATLNHPHIGAIYGLEDTGHGHALVLELVEGDTLADRLARGPLLVADTLEIARQITEGLEAAHEKGVVHRDLKPSNISITRDGVVKVLDFGLAKATAGDGADHDLFHLPTITIGGTSDGMILGTAAYMSPEQARGKSVDKRADIWAFGCVLYEMLTGKPAFAGETVSDTIVSILERQADFAALPAQTPPAVQRLLRRTLEKDRKGRLSDIADARLEIVEAIGTPSTSERLPSAPAVFVAPRWRRLLWVVSAVAVTAAGAALLLWLPRRPLASVAPLRLDATLGADASLQLTSASYGATPIGTAAVVSPDGTQLALVAQPHAGGAPRLYVRRLDQLTAAPLEDTEDAVGPFFSPDGHWLGFFSGGKLKKVAVTGGEPVTLADAPTARGATWTEDGAIIFTPTSLSGVGLWRVPAAGGTAERLTTPAQGEATHRWPQVLPGGRAVLYTVSTTPAAYSNAWLAVQPLPDGTPHVVQRNGFFGRYLSSGHLTWIRDGTLFAAPFDLATFTVTGPAAPAVPGVVSTINNGVAQVDVSRTGLLVYLAGGDTGVAAPIDWLTRDGRTDATQSHAGRLEWRTDRSGRSPAGLLSHEHRLERGRLGIRCGTRRVDESDV